MRLKLVAAIAMILCLGRSASAHRLDELLRATIVSVENDHLEASMRLIAGVAMSSEVIASIDSNGDGVFSQEEQRAYADRALREMSLSVDGVRLEPKLIAMEFPTAEQMRQGLRDSYCLPGGDTAGRA